MEDEHFSTANGRLVAVMDGHGGSAVSRYARRHLMPYILDQKPTTFEECKQAILQAIHTINTEVQRVSHWSFQGSTLVAALIMPPHLLVINIGDSRAVRCQSSGRPDPLTIDHKPHVHSEREYIHSQGGSITQSALHLWRINGNLAVSRALGDKSELPYIRATPDVFCNKLDATDEFIILATDGLWDVLSNQDAVSIVYSCNKLLDSLAIQTNRSTRHKARTLIAKLLVDEALRRGSTDNITVLIVWLKNNY